VRYAVIELELGVVLACEAFKISRCMYYYQPKLVDDTVIIDEFSALAEKHPKYGFRKLFMRLRCITINNTTQ
jgi:putative transposase